MGFSYALVRKLPIDRNMKKTDLLSMAGIYSQTLANMGKNKPVSMDVLGKICLALDCRIEDIILFIPEDKARN